MTDDEGGPMADPDEDGDDEADDGEHRRLFERTVPEILRRIVERGLERGVERLSEGPENLRNFLGDLKLPKDALHFLYGQLDDTKKGLYRVVAKEIRDVLEHTNFADEIAKLLTKLSFEVSMQVRFVPNPQALSKRPPGEEPGGGSEEPSPEEPGAPSSNEPENKAEASAASARADRWLGLPRPKVTSRIRMHTRARPARRAPRKRPG